MLEYEGLRFSMPLFLLQAFGVPLTNLIVGLIASIMLQNDLSGFIQEDLIAYGVYVIEGFALGCAVQSFIPRAIESGGRWIWIPPLLWLTYWCIDEWVLHPGQLIPDFFAWRSRPETGWGLAFVTLPTLACCFYSLGLMTADRLMRSRLAPPLTDGAQSKPENSR